MLDKVEAIFKDELKESKGVSINSNLFAHKHNIDPEKVRELMKKLDKSNSDLVIKKRAFFSYHEDHYVDILSKGYTSVYKYNEENKGNELDPDNKTFYLNYEDGSQSIINHDPVNFANQVVDKLSEYSVDECHDFFAELNRMLIVSGVKRSDKMKGVSL